MNIPVRYYLLFFVVIFSIHLYTNYSLKLIIRRKMIKEALIKKLEGDIDVAKADLKIFLANPSFLKEL